MSHLAGFRRLSLLRIIAASVALYALVYAMPVSAQTTCHLYESGTQAPQGFGQAWNTLISSRELLLKATCSGNSAQIVAGTGSQSQYIYKLGYRWNGSAWQQLSLSGSNLVANAWYVGEAFATLSAPSGTTFWVAYVCQWTGTQWKCGCRNSSCTTSYWQLQAFDPSHLAQGGGSSVTPSESGQEACQGAVSAMNYGAKGDGSTDDTKAIEAALKANQKVFLPSGRTYIVDNLVIPEGKTLCGYGATVRLKAFKGLNENFFHNGIVLLYDNVRLYGLVVDGNRDNQNFRWSDTDSASQNGGSNAIVANGANNVTIMDVIAKNAMTDGLLLGSGKSNPFKPDPEKFARNWYVKNFVADNNGRQGMSIAIAQDIVFEDCAFKNTNGRAPGFGVDIEPDKGSVKGLARIRFTRCEFSGNIAGLFNDNRYGIVDLVIEDSKFFDNSYRDLVIAGREGAGTDRVTIRGNTVEDEIRVSASGTNAPPAPHKNMLIEKNTVGNIGGAKIRSDSSITIRNNCVKGSVSGFPSGTLTASNNGANGCK